MFFLVVLIPIFLIFGFFITFMKSLRTPDELLQTGIKINTEICRIEKSSSYYYIITKGKKGDKEYHSESLEKNPEQYIIDHNILTYEIYVDPQNPDWYYFPLKELDEFLRNENN